MYKPGRLENLLEKTSEKVAVQETESSIWQTIKNKLAEIQQAALDYAPKK
jgi:hypothetical protein